MTGYLSINPDLFVTGELHEMSRVRGDRLDPRVAFQNGVDPGTRPQDRYDPATNPFGARGDVYDHTINVYGVIPNTPWAPRSQPTHILLPSGFRGPSQILFTTAASAEVRHRVGSVEAPDWPQTAALAS